MHGTLKSIAPWCFVVGILVMAIGVVFPLFHASQTKAGIARLQEFSRQLCSYRLAHGSYPASYRFPETEAALYGQLDYRVTGADDFIIEAEVPSLFWRGLRLKAGAQGVFSYSRQQQGWVLEVLPDSRCETLPRLGPRT